MKKIFLVVSVLIATVAHAQTQALKQGILANVTRLTHDGVMYENPHWSPDGSKIAFTKYGYDGLFIMSPNGADKTQLSDGAGIGYRFQWSADSHEILVRDTRWEDAGDIIARRHHALWAIDLEGNALRLSEDAEYMQPAAWRYTATGAKTIAAPDAKLLPQKRLKPLSKALAQNALQKPANHISFDYDSKNLYLIDAQGVKTILNEGPSFCPELSPDGTRVAFNQMGEVTVMNIDGSNKIIIGRGFNPSWVNDSQIVFDRTTDDGHDYTSGELYMANADGSGIKQLTATASMIEMQPQVSPDRTKIIFMSYTDGQINIADFK